MLKTKLELKTQESDMYKRECEVQRKRNVSLREKLVKVSKERDEKLERVVAETKIRHGIRMTKYLCL